MILVLNCGSSSLKYKLFDQNWTELSAGDIGVLGDRYDKALLGVLKNIEAYKNEIKEIGHRVVHGGPNIKELLPIDIQTIKIIDKYSPLAPLHNPAAISVIKNSIEKFPLSNHFAAFDNAYFNDLPAVAYTYLIDYKYANEIELRRFGFHGFSHQAMAEAFDPEHESKLITLHLGSGSSISAINCGKPIDTSMGFTPMEGLPMQTRSGDIDPGIILYMTEDLGLKKTREMLENHSGLGGISGTSGDMIALLSSDGERSKLAVELLCYRAKKYIGSYIAALGGVDKIIFSGKIGYGSELLRNKILKNIDFVEYKSEILKPDEELTIAKKIRK